MLPIANTEDTPDISHWCRNCQDTEENSLQLNQLPREKFKRKTAEPCNSENIVVCPIIARQLPTPYSNFEKRTKINNNFLFFYYYYNDVTISYFFINNNNNFQKEKRGASIWFCDSYCKLNYRGGFQGFRRIWGELFSTRRIFE